MTNLATGTFTGLIFVLAFVFTAIYSVDSAFAADSSISLSLSSSTLSLDIVPRTTTGDFAKSSSETVTVSSNHYSGYTLSIKASSETNPTDLIGTTSSTNLLNSLSSDTTEADFSNPTESAGTSYNNKWGLNFTKSGTTSDVFHPSPSTTGTTIDTTSSSGDNTYDLTIGARASINTPFDSYTNTYVLAVVGNPTPYTITYNQNTEDTVTNMPSPNPETGSVSGNTTDISTTVPARDGYDFKGWCSAITSDDTCSGTTYNPDGGGTALSLPLDQTGANNITVYAMWEESTPTLYKAVANLVKKDTNNNPRTQTVEDLQAEITQPTSTDPSKDTSNSGVYKYDPSVFGESSDASNDYDIYYYRGILDTSGHTGIYGSDGQADAYPNYVRLKDSNICWRIVRTTGSGGVKMIYNGIWTGSTCASDQANAQLLSISAFNGESYYSEQAVRVGYSYNSSYASNSTTNRPLATLFGTNSSFSGNSASSNIKTAVENWYTSNINNYTDLIESSAGYCGDRTVYDTSNVLQSESLQIPQYSTSTTTYRFGAYVRNVVNSSATGKHPSLTCAKDSNSSTNVDRSTVDLYTTTDATNGNKQLGKPASLLTADEASFAGSGITRSTSGDGKPVYHANSFLRSGSYFWLLSPNFLSSFGDAVVFSLSSDGGLGDYNVDGALGVRPAISLKNKTYIQYGKGTSTNPWVVADTPPASPVPPIGYNMQDVKSWQDKLSVGEEVIAVDSRDNKEYTVVKLNDDNIWMNQDLDFDIDSNKTYTSADTDIKADWKPSASTTTTTTWSTSSSYNNLPQSYDPGDLCWKGTITTSTSGTLSDQAQACSAAGSNPYYHVGNYYDWTAAVAMNDSGSYTSQNTDVDQSICPAGWMLPKSGTTQTGSGSFQYLVNQQGLTSYNIYASPTYFVYSGGWDGSSYNVSRNGSYWSSVVHSNSSAYILSFYASGTLSPQGGGTSSYGRPVRCVARPSE